MILAATGLQREARIVAGPEVEVVAGGGDHGRLEAALERLASTARGIISIGIAGGLAPSCVRATGCWPTQSSPMANACRPIPAGPAGSPAA